MRLALVFTVLTAAIAQQVTQDQVGGVWRGESICASARGACVDETVVYYIREIADKAGVVSIRADKVVNGQAVTMGTGEWRHDAEHHTLIWETPRQVWLLSIQGDMIRGTLTMADKAVVRRMTLKRDR